VLRPGAGAILGVAAHPGRTHQSTDVVAIDTTDAVLVHGAIGAGDQVLRCLVQLSSTRLLLAYNADGVRQWLLAEAGRRDIDPGHLEDLDRWGCIMRARSAALGTPDHLYPLGIAHDPIAAARSALCMVREIAEQRCSTAPPRPSLEAW